MGRARAIRGGLLAIGIPVGVIGLWGLLAPRSWYEDFPSSGAGWIAALGPYNEHLSRDVGALFLAIAVLFGMAAASLDRRLVQAALIAALVFDVPHLVFHVANRGGLSTADNVANIGLLSLVVVVQAVLLALSRGLGLGEGRERS